LRYCLFYRNYKRAIVVVDLSARLHDVVHDTPKGLHELVVPSQDDNHQLGLTSMKGANVNFEFQLVCDTDLFREGEG
jgi:hypothetical protein